MSAGTLDFMQQVFYLVDGFGKLLVALGVDSSQLGLDVLPNVVSVQLNCVQHISQFLVNRIFLSKEVSLNVYCQKKVPVVFAVVHFLMCGDQVAVLSNDACFLLVTGLEGDRIYPRERLRNNSNKQVKHDNHVKHCAEVEQYPHVRSCNFAKC